MSGRLLSQQYLTNTKLQSQQYLANIKLLSVTVSLVLCPPTRAGDTNVSGRLLFQQYLANIKLLSTTVSLVLCPPTRQNSDHICAEHSNVFLPLCKKKHLRNTSLNQRSQFHALKYFNTAPPSSPRLHFKAPPSCTNMIPSLGRPPPPSVGIRLLRRKF